MSRPAPTCISAISHPPYHPGSAFTDNKNRKENPIKAMLHFLS